MMIRFTLAERLKRYREDANLTIYEVGDKIGKSGKTVSAWECGRGQPDADMLLTLCHLYGINSIAELYGEEGNPPALESDEAQLLEDYRNAEEPIRQAAAVMLHDSAERNRAEKQKKDGSVG